MDKIIIFKSDRVGDLINISPCLKIIKDEKPNSHITLVCSSYNFQVAKNYKFINKFIILDKKNIVYSLVKNFRFFFTIKYDYLFQFDGKNISYLISYFIKSKNKSTLCFVKNKFLHKFSYKVYRPQRYLLKKNFNNYIFCNEDYAKNDNNNVHYQTLYFTLLNNLNFKTSSKQNIFYLDKTYELPYLNFIKINDVNQFYVFHIDKKSDSFNENDLNNIIKIIDKISTHSKIFLTTGLEDFTFLNYLKKKYNLCYYERENFFYDKKPNLSDNVLILNKIPLNLLAYFLKNSIKNISNHSGFVVHASAAFNKDFIDIIKSRKNNELDRWIPLISKYERLNFEDIDDKVIENIKF